MVSPVQVCNAAFNGFVCQDITWSELCGWMLVAACFAMLLMVAAAIFDWLDSGIQAPRPQVQYVPRNRKTLMRD